MMFYANNMMAISRKESIEDRGGKVYLCRDQSQSHFGARPTLQGCEQGPGKGEPVLGNLRLGSKPKLNIDCRIRMWLFGTLIRANHHLITMVIRGSGPMHSGGNSLISDVLQCTVAYIKTSTSQAELNIHRIVTGQMNPSMTVLSGYCDNLASVLFVFLGFLVLVYHTVKNCDGSQAQRMRMTREEYSGP